MVMETHRPQPSPPSHINQLQDHNQHHGSSILNAGSSNFHQMSISPFPIAKENSSICGHNSASHKQYEEEDHKRKKISPKLMPATEPRSMQETVTENNTGTDSKPTQISPRLQNQQRRCRHVNASTSSANTGSNTIRVCADCNTTTTPLWRSGPRGPKSLCNACGIRRRKQRKVMAEVSVAAANGLPVPDASSTKNNRRHKKEKKPLVNHLAQFKNKSRSAAGAATCTSQVERKLSFEDFTFWTHNSAFRQAFPRDEVADAAVLLMELSCGFAHL